jgi:hypothetical protein
MEEFRNRAVIVELSCSHLVHGKCLNRWFGENETCPECRAPIFDAEKDEDEDFQELFVDDD